MCLRGFDAGLLEYLARQSSAIVAAAMAGKDDRATITGPHQLGPVAPAAAACDAVALCAQERERSAVIEDRVPHGANVRLEPSDLARAAPIGTEPSQTATKS